MSTHTITDENGNVTVVEESQDLPLSPNWKGLSQSLFYSAIFQKAKALANPNAYSTLLKVLTDGENTYASENAFLICFNWLDVNFTQSEKTELNTILANNNFTITI